MATEQPDVQHVIASLRQQGIDVVRVSYSDMIGVDRGRDVLIEELPTATGGGPHLCMGNQLARMEIKIMFQEILARVDRVEQAGELVRVRSNFVNGIKQFPVQLSRR